MTQPPRNPFLAPNGRSNIHDDAYMTYWPAYALAHLGGIVNYSGHSTEQSSTLLFVLLLAAVSKLFAAHLPTLARLCSLAFGLAGVVLAARCATIAGPRGAAAVAPYFLATMAYFAFWSTSGMETTLVALLLLLLVMDIPRYLESDSALRFPTLLLVSLYVLVRPETAVVLRIVPGAALSKRSRALALVIANMVAPSAACALGVGPRLSASPATSAATNTKCRRTVRLRVVVGEYMNTPVEAVSGSITRNRRRVGQPARPDSRARRQHGSAWLGKAGHGVNAPSRLN
jgi:hypothetical protein